MQLQFVNYEHYDPINKSTWLGYWKDKFINKQKLNEHKIYLTRPMTIWKIQSVHLSFTLSIQDKIANLLDEKFSET